MATPFADLYEAVRVATGNDDPVVGAEVMPESRIDVLIRTAVPVLPSYSGSFQAISCWQNADTFAWELLSQETGVPELRDVTKTAIALVAAHRYFIGLGNKMAATELYAMISDLAVVAGGEPVMGYKALGVLPERFQVV